VDLPANVLLPRPGWMGCEGKIRVRLLGAGEACLRCSGIRLLMMSIRLMMLMMSSCFCFRSDWAGRVVWGRMIVQRINTVSKVKVMSAPGRETAVRGRFANSFRGRMTRRGQSCYRSPTCRRPAPSSPQQGTTCSIECSAIDGKGCWVFPEVTGKQGLAKDNQPLEQPFR
jgi:hypothetical protein